MKNQDITNQSGIVKIYQGVTIRIREDRYVCLTDMAKANNRKVAQWLLLSSTKTYIEALVQVVGKPTSVLLEVGHGTPTWAHPKLAIRFAQWCSDSFAVQVDFWIDELMTTGKVSIAPEQPPLSLMQQIAAMALASHEQNVQIELIKQQQALESSRLDELTDVVHQHDSEIERLFSPNGDYFSVVGYAKSRKLSIGLKTASAIGKKCTAYC